MKKNAFHKALALALTAGIVLSGCGGNSSAQVSNSGAAAAPSASEASQAPQDKEINITMWVGTAFKNVDSYGPNYGDYESAKAAEFKQTHPNVNIKVEVVPWKDIEQKVNVAVAGDNPPDILYDNVPLRIIRHAREGNLEPLDAIVADDKADWKQSYLDVASVDGTLYSAMTFSYPGMIFVNKHIFDEKGLSDLLPKDRRWTWEQWQDAISKVADGSVYGTAFFAKSEQQDQLMQSMLMSSGAEWANADFSEYLLNSDKGAEALSFMVGLIDKGLVAPGATNMESNDNIELFKQGKLATMYQMPAVYDLIESGKKDGSVDPSVEPYGIIPIYKEGVTPKLVVTSQNGYAVFKQKDDAKRQACLDFVKMLVEPENMKSVSKNVLADPARVSAEYQIDNPDFAALKPELNKLEIIDLGRHVAWYSKLRQAFYPELQAAFLKTKTPQQALDDFVKQANELAKTGK